MLNKLGINDKIFYKTFFMLAIPMAMQNLVTTSVNLIDNIMIGQLGSVPIAAVGLANRIFFVFAIMIFGVSGGTSAFISQFLGKKDYEGIRKVVGINLFISFSLSLVFFIFAFLKPEFLMSILTNDNEVIKLGADYLKVVSPSYIMSSFIFVFSYTSKSMEHPKIPLISSLLSIVVNTVLNYIFIFGKLGMPVMGVKGAALGTVIARMVEVLFITFFTFKNISILRSSIKDYLNLKKDFVMDYIKTVLPVTGNETFWALGATALSAIYARVSTDAVAGVNIINIIFDLSSVFVFGASHAAGVMVGKEVGAKRKELAYTYTTRFSIIMTGVGLAMGILIIPLAPQFVKLFKIEPSVINIVLNLTYILAIMLPFRSFNHLNIVGTLRSGGDTVFCFVADVSVMWVIEVGIAFFMGIVLKMPIEVVYFSSQCGEIVKAFIVYLRIRKNNWIKDLVNK